MRLGEYSKERMGELEIGLDRLSRLGGGDCGKIPFLGLMGNPNAAGRSVVVEVDAIIERNRCAKDMGDRHSSLIAVETEKRSGGNNRSVGIGEIASSSSIAKGTDLGEVRCALECLQDHGGNVGDVLVSGLC